MMKRVGALLIVLLLITATASAAELSKGGKLNGAAPKTLPVALKVGDLVEGPATVKTAAGETILVSAQSELEVKAPDKGVELFFIRKGSVRAEIGDKTQISVPVGWLAVPKGKKAEIYAETMSSTRAFAKANKGDAVLSYDKYSILLGQGQGIEVWTLPGQKGDICFTTHQNNPGDMTLLARVTATLDVELSIPKATTGCVEQIEAGAKTKLRSEPSSWKGGKIGIKTRLSGAAGQSGSLGPGTFALINNKTGAIEIGFEEVDFAIIERAISLTSEFSSLATSNFFGLSK